jgi:TRAP-type C4-dicarboxylate transport system permease large subunit
MALVFVVVRQFVATASAQAVKRHVLIAGTACALSLALYAALFGYFVVDAPNAHDQDVRGFRLQPAVASLMETRPSLTPATLLEGAENRPDRVWELWTVVVARVCLLAGWLALTIALAAIVALLFALGRMGANSEANPGASRSGAG